MKFARLAPVVAALLLAACHSRPDPALTVELSAPQPRSVQREAYGIDLATDASDVLNQLKDSGVAFVARYYRTPTSRWPALSASEAQRLSALGVKIVAVWEPLYPYPDYFSYASGYYDALAAYSQAKAVGQPAGSAIYFAVDFDARHQALASVDRYFRGIAAGLAAASRGRAEFKIGVYGSGAVCSAVKQAGLAQYAWLSNSRAWAGWGYGGWDIRQVGRLANLFFDHDADEARAEYGGFQVTSKSIAAPYVEAARQPPQPPRPRQPS